MSKSNLPSNWIECQSKVRPGKVYYFNKKTKESAWELPSTDDDDKDEDKQGPVTKRKKFDKNRKPDSSRLPVSKNDSTKNTQPERKILVAKRLLPSSSRSTTPAKETPQMIVLREKIAKRKEQQMLSKNNKSNNKTQKVQQPKVQSKCTSPKAAQVKHTSTNEEKLTPQMKTTLETIQQRSSKRRISMPVRQKQGVEKLSPNKTVIESNSETESFSPELSIASTSSRSISSRRSETCTSGISPKSSELMKPKRTIYKKNVAKERMEKLRRSLKLEEDKVQPASSPRKSLAATPERGTCDSDVEILPNVYQNSKVRLTRLTKKLTRQQQSLLKNISDSEVSETDHSLSHTNSAVTVDDLVKKAFTSSMCEEMEWEPLEDEEITYEVQTVRNKLCDKSSMGDKSNIFDNNLWQTVTRNQQEKKQLYIVIDTNVYLSNIEAVKVVRETRLRRFDEIIIVVPWTVICELDYIKDNKKQSSPVALIRNARIAIDYLNKLFSSKQRIVGQTSEEAKKNKMKFEIECPDDEILQTCLQIRDLRKSVVLLSYDKNLCNKAMIFDITTLGRNDPLEKVDYLNVNEGSKNLILNLFDQSRSLTKTLNAPVPVERDVVETVFDDLKFIIKHFLTQIVSKEMHVLYGDSWENYVIIRPPWTTVSVLKCTIKHWIAATSESFSRAAQEILKELLQIFNDYLGGAKKIKDVMYVIERCLDLVQLTNTDKHSALMLETLQKINDLKKQLSEYGNQQNRQNLIDVIGVENNTEEQQRRAEKAFRYFEAAYAHSRDMCGLAAEAVGMPFSIPFVRPQETPPLNYIKRVKAELAAQVIKLLHNLSSALEEADNGCIDPRTLQSLHQTLTTILPENILRSDELLVLDVYCCIQQKKEVLQAGLRQLQELSTQFCSLTSYRRTQIDQLCNTAGRV